MSIMIFDILFFLGIFSMFVFTLVGQEKLLKQVRKELAASKAQLENVENLLLEMTGRSGKGGKPEVRRIKGNASSQMQAPRGAAKREAPRGESFSADMQAKPAMRTNRESAALSVPLSSKPVAPKPSAQPLAPRQEEQVRAQHYQDYQGYEGRPVGQTTHAAPRGQELRAPQSPQPQYEENFSGNGVNNLSLSRPAPERQMVRSEGANLDLFMPPPRRK